MALSCLLRRSSTIQGFRPFQQLIQSPTVLVGSNLNIYNSKTDFAPVKSSNIVFHRLSGMKFSTTTRLDVPHSDHVPVWKLERMLSAIMLPIIPTIFFVPSKGLEALLALCLTIHNHWGMEAIVVDYLREKVFGPVVPRIGQAFIFVVSIITVAGLLNLIYNDAGIAASIGALWKL